MTNETVKMPSKAKKENPFISLFINIVIPTFIMMKGAKPEYLGPVNALIVGLAFQLSTLSMICGEERNITSYRSLVLSVFY